MISIRRSCHYIFIFFFCIAHAADQFASSDAWKLSVALESIKNLSIYDTNYPTLTENAIKGMLPPLDEYAEYLDTKSLAIFNNQNNTGQFVGIGIELKPHPQGAEIISCFDNTPAYTAGLRSGDIITHVNGYDIKNMPTTQVLSLLRGKAQSIVEITTYNLHTPSHVLHIKRQPIPLLEYKLLNNNILYIRIRMFTEKTDGDIDTLLQKTQKKTLLHGLIIDLRDNPGGPFNSAVSTTDLFLDSTRLKKNTVIVSTTHKEKTQQLVAYATPGDIIPDVPIIILINEGTASAAEIMASALKEYKRAVIIGQKSYGKGSIQSIIHLDKNSALKLTTGFYLSAKGQTIQGIGVEPNIKLTPNSTLTQDAWIAHAEDIIMRKNYEIY